MTGETVAVRPKLEVPKKPELRIPEKIREKVEKWTETGRDWLARLRGMTAEKPREVIEEVGKAQEKQEEFVSETVVLGQSRTEEVRESVVEKGGMIEFSDEKRVLSRQEVKQESKLQSEAERRKILKEIRELRNLGKHEEARTKVNDFYGAEQQRFEQERLIRDLGRVMEEYNVVFIHGLTHKYVPEGASMLREGAGDWDMKLDILCALEPTIATSTIQEGDGEGRIWCPQRGIILSGGGIQSANRGDAGTVAVKGMKRWVRSSEFSIEEAINDAINNRVTTGVNEITVEDPKIAGFYIGLNENDELIESSRDFVPIEEMIEKTEELGIPLYVIKKGLVYNCEYFSHEQGIKSVGEPIPPTELCRRYFQASKAQKDRIFDEIIKKSPFEVKRLDIPDLHCVNASNLGRSLCIELQNPANLPGENTIYQSKKGESKPWDLREGVEAKKIAENCELGTQVEYFVVDDELYRRETGFSGQATTERVYHSGHQGGFFDISTEEIGLGPVSNSQDFLINTEHYLNFSDDDLGRSDLDRHQRTKIGRSRRSLAFFLHGFAKQAEELGDKELQTKAIILARRVISEEEYGALLKERVGKNGEFVFKREDLEPR